MDLQQKIDGLSQEKKRLLLQRLKARAAQRTPPKIAALPRTDEGFRLSFAQERLWFLETLTPGNTFYNIPTVVPLTAPVNTLALGRAINKVVRRHESLRTVFKSVGGDARQIILPHADRELEVVRLPDGTESERRALAEKLVNEEAQRPFNLEHGPPFRALLVDCGKSDFLLVLVMHHIVSDGWSMGILFNELSQLYTAELYGKHSKLPELPIQYADFAEWQRQWLQGEELQRQIDYWRQQLADLQPLQLPTDRPRPALQSYSGDYVPISLSPNLTASLVKLSRQEGVTLFMLLLSAFDLLLYRYTGQRDIAVGTYLANRNHGEIEGLIGFFINTLVMRCDLSGDPSFLELLKRTQRTALGAYAHQDLPFPTLVNELQPERDLSRNPLFQVVFHLFNAPTAVSSARPATSPVPQIKRHAAIFDIVLELTEFDGALSGGLEFSTDLFDRSSIERMGEHFLCLLESIVAAPQLRLSEHAMINTAERRRLLQDFNGALMDVPFDKSIASLFDDQVARTPDAVALVSGERAIRYSEIAARANRLSHYLIERGAGPEVLVAVALERSIEAVIAMLAVAKAGAACLPLDPQYPLHRLQFILEDSGARVMISRRALESHFSGTSVSRVWLDSDAEAIGRCPAISPPDRASASNLAYVLYTSGSTGVPKGAANEYRQLLNRLHWMWERYPFRAGEVSCLKTSLNFIDSLWEIYGPLLKGLRSVVIPAEMLRDPYLLVDALATHGVTRIWLVPSLLRLLLDTFPSLQARLPKLTFWVCSGEELSASLHRRFREQMPGATLYNVYGTSEIWDATWFEPSAEQEFEWRVPIGRAMGNVETYVLDPDRNLVPVGIPGELYVGGAGLPRGYINRPDLEQERLVKHPFSQSATDRLYRTGDFVRMRADGNLEFVGRRDNQIKIRGFRVELEEIESVLGGHPAVKDCAVVAYRHENDWALVAYVTQNPGYRGGNGHDKRTSADVRGFEEASTWSLDKEAQWLAIWDATYRGDKTSGDRSFNTSGFISSYTGQQIPPEEIEEWVDQAVTHVLARRPRRILEIGCGAGLLALRLAPECECYVGTDFSPAAIDYVSRQAAHDGLSHAQFLERSADDFSDLPDKSFDMVVVHSVTQYFPTVEYLLRVIQGAARLLADGGTLYFGDVRNLSLLEAFYATVELARMEPGDTAWDLNARIGRRLAREQELAIEPRFWLDLATDLPELGDVHLELKGGRHNNEFTRFRYDVFIAVRPPAPGAGPAVRVLDWAQEQLTPEHIRRELGAGDDQVLRIDNIPNARLDAPLRVLELLESSNKHGRESVAPMVEMVELMAVESLSVGSIATGADSAVDPQNIREIADGLPYRSFILCPQAGHESTFDAVFLRNDAGEYRPQPTAPERMRPPRPWQSYANNPLQGIFAQSLVPELRAYLDSRLPEFQVPQVFKLLDRLPLTPSGKIDRRKLPEPGRELNRRTKPLVHPRNASEQALATLWKTILNIGEVGIHDDFFAELGGHSLLAAQLVSRARHELRIELPVRTLFENPTIADLADAISELDRDRPSGDAIARLDRSRYRSSDHIQ